MEKTSKPCSVVSEADPGRYIRRDTGGEVKDMADDEERDQEAGPDHVLAGEVGFELFLHRIPLGIGGLVFKGDLDGVVAMHQDENQHDEPERPYQRRQCMQMFGIGIDAAGDEDRGVAKQMDDDEQNHQKAGYGHQEFSADSASK